MKTLKLIVIAIVLFFANELQAQVTVSVNLPSPPMWGPVGYTDVQYYYLPDVEAYYDVQTSMFIYLNGGVWVRRTYLPNRYRNYDLYGGYKVVMNNYHGNSPYDHFNDHRKQYRRGYHGDAQRTIGENPRRKNTGVNSHQVKRSNNRDNHDNNNLNRNNNRDNHNANSKVNRGNNNHNGHGNIKNNSNGGGNKNMKKNNNRSGGKGKKK